MVRLDEFVQKRHYIAERYNEALADLAITIPWQHPDAWSSYHLYPIRVRQDECGKTQRQVYDAFKDAGINVNLHYIPVYRQPYYEDMAFKTGYCPEAEKYYKEAISLPMFPSLSNEQQTYVIEVLCNEFG